MNLKQIQEKCVYTLTFDVNELTSKQRIICVEVLIKLPESVKLRNIDTNEIKWYRTMTPAQILDEVPVKYLRKEKLKKLDELDEQE